MPQQRKGKIARLPFEEREAVCRMMRDGYSSTHINAYLIRRKCQGAPFNPQNFTNWRQGGYQDWLAEQSRLDTIRDAAASVRRECEARGEAIFDQLAYDYAVAVAHARSDATDPAAVEKLSRAAAAILNARSLQLKLELDAKKTALAQQSAHLEQQKFRLKFSEMFLEFYANTQARQIAESGAGRDVKIQQLLAFMQSMETPDTPPNHPETTTP